MGRERAGLARAFLVFLVGLGAAGLILSVLNGPFETMSATAGTYANTPQANQGQQWLTMFWDALPVIIVILAFLQLLGAAAAERRLPGQ